MRLLLQCAGANLRLCALKRCTLCARAEIAKLCALLKKELVIGLLLTKVDALLLLSGLERGVIALTVERINGVRERKALLTGKVRSGETPPVATECPLLDSLSRLTRHLGLLLLIKQLRSRINHRLDIRIHVLRNLLIIDRSDICRRGHTGQPGSGIEIALSLSSGLIDVLDTSLLLLIDTGDKGIWIGTVLLKRRLSDILRGLVHAIIAGQYLGRNGYALRGSSCFAAAAHCAASFHAPVRAP